MTFTLNQIAEITGAQILSLGTLDSACEVSAFITDSRSLATAEGTAFCAIRTDASDGHRYIAQMARAGVRVFIVSDARASVPSGCAVLLVADVRQAIAALGTEARKRLQGKLIAITGSAGKTVVKEMLFQALLSRGIKVFRSPRSWNSRLGVPLSLLEMAPDTEVAIIEVGIDSVGDMDAHARMLRPDLGILTAITAEHDAGFADTQQKIAEKLRLFAPERCTTIIYDASNTQLTSIIEAEYGSRRLLAFSGSDAADADTNCVRIAVAELGLPEPEALRAVSSRLDVHEGVNDCLMIYDNFTHDVRSLRSVLDFTRRRAVSSRSNTVILGDLLHAPKADLHALYANAARTMAAFGIDRVIAVGAEASAHADAFAGVVTAVECVPSQAEFLRRYDINNFTSETILISCEPGAESADIRDLLENPRHDTIFEINLDSLVHNFNYYRSLLRPSTGLIAMVKASAYGTGAPGIARTLQAQGAAYLAVAVVDEGVELRRSGITMPIMVLNPITTNYKALFDYRLEPSVFSLRELETLRSQAERFGVTDFPVHIKFDTGMHRVGFIASETDALADALIAQRQLRACTMFSHLATADCLDQDAYTGQQLETFEQLSSRLAARLPYPVKRHILNTAGIMRCPEQYQYDFVRLGIGLYGVSPLPGPSPLKVVASLSSTIISLKHWEAGTTIGYGRRGVLSRPSVIATVPIGYADGLDRHLSCGAAGFVVRGVMCPTVGNICMDQCMVDVTEVPGAAIGDRVEIFGPGAPVEHLADVLTTIPYEVLTSVSPRVKRIYFRE